MALQDRDRGTGSSDHPGKRSPALQVHAGSGSPALLSPQGKCPLAWAIHTGVGTGALIYEGALKIAFLFISLL